MQDWVRDEVNKLNNVLYAQGATPQSFFGQESIFNTKEQVNENSENAEN